MLKSLALTALTVLTAWLLIPVFVLPPLAFYYGYQGYRRRHDGRTRTSVGAKILSSIPMLLAAAVFCFGIYLITTQYRA